ncbi:MAG: 3-dehydroquinate synthase [Acutalibacter sp.]|jgi:3-dehydroquinate synthase
MKLDIETARPYSVYIESGLLDRVGEIAQKTRKPGSQAMLISDSNVFPLYGERVRSSLEKAGFVVSSFVFPAGEPSKQISTVCDMYQALAEKGFTRTDFIVTLGGGVTGDMGGFAAATYLRGIAFLQVPTTLLSQVDASVGGKTGVDLPFGKNLVGAFHQPEAVLADPDTLKTLPEHFFRDGMGEVVKYGCISDQPLFQALEAGTALEDLENLLARCVASKKSFVEEDTRDTGRRMILNFGHTFGHALEKLHDFQGLSHGEAVGIGMVLASRVGEKLGVTPQGTAERIRGVLEKYGLPTSSECSWEEIVDATALDKKSDGSMLRMILLTEIGEAVIRPMTREELKPLLKGEA